MRIPVLATVTALVLGGSWLLAQDPKPDDPPAPKLSLFPEGYHNHEALTTALKRVARETPESVEVKSLAKSIEGRDVWLVTVNPRRDAKAAPRPSILIVANLEADHLVGSHVALGLAERLAKEDDDIKKLVDNHTFYIIPRLNPDGAERQFARPRGEFRGNLRPLDRDRDRRSSEDGGDDLNGDGFVTSMRLKDSKATMVADAKDARILRKADAAKGERPVYSEQVEGKDEDGDGSINEDPPSGVNLNRNWPHRWTEFEPETGYAAASEPEVRALIEFAFAHPEIVAVWTFGLNDNLKAEPKKPGTTIDDADLPFFVEMSRVANKEGAAKKDEAKGEPAKGADAPKEKEKEAQPTEPTPEERARMIEQLKAATPEKRAEMIAQFKGQRGGGRRGSPPTPASAPSTPTSTLEGTTDGALSEWAYHQFGVVGLASRLWASPEIPDTFKDAPADGEARWLFWNDKVMDGRAFVPFKPFDHPKLGAVEIGGWEPGTRLNPPIEAVAKITDAQLAFLKQLARKTPRLAIADVEVESKGGGLFDVRAGVVNEGYFPTALAQGVRTRKAPLVLVRLKHGEVKLLVGKALNRVDSLGGSGGRQGFRWLVLAPEGVKSVSLEVSTPKAGRVEKVIELRETAVGDPVRYSE